MPVYLLNLWVVVFPFWRIASMVLLFDEIPILWIFVLHCSVFLTIFFLLFVKYFRYALLYFHSKPLIKSRRIAEGNGLSRAGSQYLAAMNKWDFYFQHVRNEEIKVVFFFMSSDNELELFQRFQILVVIGMIDEGKIVGKLQKSAHFSISLVWVMFSFRFQHYLWTRPLSFVYLLLFVHFLQSFLRLFGLLLVLFFIVCVSQIPRECLSVVSSDPIFTRLGCTLKFSEY